MKRNGQTGACLIKKYLLVKISRKGNFMSINELSHSTVEFEEAIKKTRPIYGSEQLFMALANSKKSRQVPMDYRGRGHAAGDRPNGPRPQFTQDMGL